VGALTRYGLARLTVSQRYLPPVLLFLAVVVVLTTEPGGSLFARYAACAFAQFLSMAWLTVVVVNGEDPVERSVTVVAAGGARRVLLADVLAVGAVHAGLVVFGLLYPLHAGTGPAAAVAVGLVAQLTAGAAGISVGLPCSRLVVPRPGYAVLTALTLVLLMLLVPYPPAVNPTLRLLSHPADAGAVLGPLLVQAGGAAAMLACSITLTHAVARRRA